MNLLEICCPGQWKYVGDGALWLGGKNPDFVHVSKPLIIELWGLYWHKDQDPLDRINCFEPFGYSVFIMWENGIKDKKMPELLRYFSSQELPAYCYEKAGI